ncbi:MAG TPA: ABC transporter permease [Nitriliruptorales bacterium]|nr:ABC transporter permease [Nitriliruptorales bacterium]
MKLGEAARVALEAIRANRLRSGLTTLGVVIGVLAVILLVAIGQGAREEITATIEDLGSNLLLVFPGQADLGQAPTRSRFTLRDVEEVGRELGDPGRVAADLVSGEVVRARNASAFVSVLGVTRTFPNVVTRRVERGDHFSASDVATGRRVAVLGASVADELFPGRDPMGATLTIAGLRFRVTGVLERVGASFGPDRDAQVLVPITAAQRLFRDSRVDAIFVRARTTDSIEQDASRVRTVLSRRFRADEFSILTQQDLIGVAGRVLQLLTLVLAAIAGISLLVGGVGVSNIMLVSVSERTREIGLRKALGARTRDITLQFLLEAVVLTGAGGFVGILSGTALAVMADRFSPLPAVVTGWSVTLAVTVSVAVGVLFGVWPAWRAGRLDPVAALRHE